MIGTSISTVLPQRTMKKKAFHEARKGLSKKRLLAAVRDCFAEIEDAILGRGFQLSDYLMSGLAVFSLKYSSLLQFDRAARNEEISVHRNLRNLFGVNGVPSDSALRKRLDELDPRNLRSAFKKLFFSGATGKSFGGLQVSGWTSFAFGRRYGIFFFKDGELSTLLREASSGWECDVLSSDAVWRDRQS